MGWVPCIYEFNSQTSKLHTESTYFLGEKKNTLQVSIPEAFYKDVKVFGYERQ
jgi:hypothetical protein